MEWMHKAFGSRFVDLAITAPCCGLGTNLNALRYLPPAGFARFSLTAKDPDVGGVLNRRPLRSGEGNWLQDPSSLGSILVEKLANLPQSGHPYPRLLLIRRVPSGSEYPCLPTLR
jgi:hypothetical protein